MTCTRYEAKNVTRRLTLARKKELVLAVGHLAPEERKPFLAEINMGEEEFQTMNDRYYEYGLSSLLLKRTNHIRRKEKNAKKDN